MHQQLNEIPLLAMIPLQGGNLPDWGVIGDAYAILGRELPRIRNAYQFATRQMQVVIQAINDMTTKVNQIIAVVDSRAEILDGHNQSLNGHTEVLDEHTRVLEEHTKILKSHTKALENLQISFKLMPLRIANVAAEPASPLRYPETHPYVPNGPLPRLKQEAIEMSGDDALAALVYLGVLHADIPPTAPERVIMFRDYIGA